MKPEKKVKHLQSHLGMKSLGKSVCVTRAGPQKIELSTSANFFSGLRSSSSPVTTFLYLAASSQPGSHIADWPGNLPSVTLRHCELQQSQAVAQSLALPGTVES